LVGVRRGVLRRQTKAASARRTRHRWPTVTTRRRRHGSSGGVWTCVRCPRGQLQDIRAVGKNTGVAWRHSEQQPEPPHPTCRRQEPRWNFLSPLLWQPRPRDRPVERCSGCPPAPLATAGRSRWQCRRPTPIDRWQGARLRRRGDLARGHLADRTGVGRRLWSPEARVMVGDRMSVFRQMQLEAQSSAVSRQRTSDSQGGSSAIAAYRPSNQSGCQ
jgi:hypothetical protein